MYSLQTGGLSIQVVANAGFAVLEIVKTTALQVTCECIH